MLNTSLHTKGVYDLDAQIHFWLFLINYPKEYMIDLFLSSKAFYFVWNNFSMPGFYSARKLILKYFYLIISSSKEKGHLFLQIKIHEFLKSILVLHDNLKTECIELIQLILMMFPEITKEFLDKSLVDSIYEVIQNSNFKFKTTVCLFFFKTLTFCEVPCVLDFLEKIKEMLFLTIDIILEEINDVPKIKEVLNVFCLIVSKLQNQQDMHQFYKSFIEHVVEDSFQDHLVEIMNSSNDSELMGDANYLLSIEVT